MRRICYASLLIFAILLMAGCGGEMAGGQASDDKASCAGQAADQPIKVEAAWTRATGMASNMATPATETMEMPKNSAAYMLISNCGAADDELVGAKSAVGEKTTIMISEMKDGKSSMRDIEKIDIPAGKKVELKPGGYHVMFMMLKKDLAAGDPVELTLVFKNAGEIKVSAPVKAP